jgi:light-regulated signal transduction histidine kinase (bacteriophytochrome)
VATSEMNDLWVVMAHSMLSSLAVVDASITLLQARGDEIDPEHRDSLLASAAEHSRSLQETLQDLLGLARTDVVGALDELPAQVHGSGRALELTRQSASRMSDEELGEEVCRLVAEAARHRPDVESVLEMLLSSVYPRRRPVELALVHCTERSERDGAADPDEAETWARAARMLRFALRSGLFT